MTDNQSSPIIVPSSSKAEQLTVGVRQLVLALGVFAATIGYTKAGTILGAFAMVVGPIITVASIVFGQLHARKSAQTLATVAAAAPDEIAVVKS